MHLLRRRWLREPKVRVVIVSYSSILTLHIEDAIPPSRIHVQCDPEVQEAYANLTESEIKALVESGTELRNAKSKVVKYGHARTISATYQIDHIHAEVRILLFDITIQADS
jgi:hypothetical protein